VTDVAAVRRTHVAALDRAQFGDRAQPLRLAGNPWKSVKLQLSSHERFRHEPSSTRVRDLALAKDEWDCLLEFAQRLAGSERQARAKVIIRLAGQAGLRRDELANVSTGNLNPVMTQDPHTGERRKRYLLQIRGKGGVERRVPMTLELDRCLGEYLQLRGLSPLPAQCPPATPLVAALTTEQRTEARL
jgi:integrase